MSKLKSAAIAIAACLGLSVTTAMAGGHTSAPGDIVEVAASNGSFNTLVAAVTAADLVDALKGDGPLTVFAPTDEAFAALPAGTVENLLKPENIEQLQAILLYHVVPGQVMCYPRYRCCASAASKLASLPLRRQINDRNCSGEWFRFFLKEKYAFSAAYRRPALKRDAAADCKQSLFLLSTCLSGCPSVS